MKKKIYHIVLLLIMLLSLATGYFYYAHVAKQEANMSYAREEVLIYGTEAESVEDCTSYEDFDPEAMVCYFECTNDAECKDIERDIEEELGSWTDADSEGDYIHGSNEDNIPSDDSSLVSEYKVTEGEKINLTKGSQSSLDNEVWSSISNLSPDSLSNEYIETFQVFDNPKDDTLAFVDDEDGDGMWRIAVNLAGYRGSNTKERNLTVVHELGHMITLNNDQVNSDYTTCKNYSTDEGCAKSSSYLNQFVKRFWTNEDITSSKKESNNLYIKDKYVTEYASTNPEEDLAESFAYFVISGESDVSRSTRTKDDKLAFFKTYSELVTIKIEMLNGLKSNMIRARKASNQ